MSTKIEWCDLTINPVVGCSKCSPGCDNCYAETFAARLAKNPNLKIAAKYRAVVDKCGKWNGLTLFDISCLLKLPKKPKRIFVCSMADLFHESVSFGNIAHILGHLALTKSNAHHTFILLTKRPARMKAFFEQWEPYRDVKNLWLGVTVCNQAEADEKIPLLLVTPAARRFVSIEPMLGEIALQRHFLHEHCRVCKGTERNYTGLHSFAEGHFVCDDGCDLTAYPWATHWMRGLDWVICGGETGPNARPMHPDWVRSLAAQCNDAHVPFFFKGWGEYYPFADCFLSSREGGNHSPYTLLPERFRTGRYTHPSKTNWISPEGYSFGRAPWSNEPESWKHPLPENTWWTFKCGKKHAGRLLDGVEYNNFPGGGV